jgi:transcriptional regulator with XRE-family HTH domain
MKLTENLRLLRKKSGMTQAELAKRLHIKQYNVSDYEIGRIEPNIQTLVKLADVFNVTVDFLIGRKADAGMGVETRLNDYIGQMQVDKYLISIYDAIKDLPEEKKKQVRDTVNFIVTTFGH